jgi:hypothetical protein
MSTPNQKGEMSEVQENQNQTQLEETHLMEIPLTPTKEQAKSIHKILSLYAAGGSEDKAAKLLEKVKAIGVKQPLDWALIDAKMIEEQGFAKFLTPIDKNRLLHLTNFIQKTNHYPKTPTAILPAAMPTSQVGSPFGNSSSALLGIKGMNAEETKELVKALVNEFKDSDTDQLDDDKRKSFAKFQIKPLPTFSGAIEDYYSWTIKTKNLLGQAEFDRYLDNKEYAHTHKQENGYLFYLLESALLGGDLAHLAAEFASSRDGHSLWHRIDNWFLQIPGQKGALSRITRQRLENIHLNENMTVPAYINEFMTARITMEQTQTPIDDSTLLDIFITHIVDDNYKTH